MKNVLLINKIKSLQNFSQWQILHLQENATYSSNIELLHLPCNTINIKRVKTLFIRGLNCNKCNNKNVRLSTQEFLDKYHYILKEWSLPNDFQYQNNKTLFNITHIKCNTTITTCRNFIDRNKLFCPLCDIKRKSYNSTFAMQRLIKKYPTLDFKEAVYISATTPLKVRCKICNTIYLKPPTTFHQCEQCYKSKIATQHKNKILVLSQQYANFDFKQLHNNEYQGNCKRCNTLRIAKSTNIIKSFSCKKCDVKFGNSNLEQQFTNYIKSLTTQEIIINTRDLIPPYEVDIYIPSLHLAIEFNGTFWHSFKVLNNRKQDGVNYHLHKTLLALQKEIYLIHIFEDEWIKTPDVIKNYLSQLFSLTNPLKMLHNGKSQLDICKYPFLLENRLYRITPPVLINNKYYNCGYATYNYFPTFDYTPPYVELAIKDATLDNYKVAYYYKDFNLAIDTIQLQEHITFTKDYLYKKYQHLKSKNIRLICVYYHYATDLKLKSIIDNVILHALNKITTRYYARNLELQISPAHELKQFFIDNNIHGYKSSTTAFCLKDPATQEIIMAYAVGHAYFGKNKYDAEITRGACKINTIVIGGASKLWNAIINYYATHKLDNTNGTLNSIVYYVDLNLYNGQSMQFLNNIQFIKENYGFWNYFVETQHIKNRTPALHKEIDKLINTRHAYNLYNVGTQTNVWTRYPNQINNTETAH